MLRVIAGCDNATGVLEGVDRLRADGQLEGSIVIHRATQDALPMSAKAYAKHSPIQAQFNKLYRVRDPRLHHMIVNHKRLPV
jgi:hypothetical protein